jgi:hypothetical protein
LRPGNWRSDAESGNERSMFNKMASTSAWEITEGS